LNNALAVILCSCVQGDAMRARKMAIETTSKIHQGMTFAEIAKIIPLSTNLYRFDAEHGGVWYDVPFNGKYYFQLRFEHPFDYRNRAPDAKTNIEDCVLNLPAILRENGCDRILAKGDN